KDVSIKIDLKCDEPIKSIYSPSHDIDVHHDGEYHAVVGFEARDVPPDTDFKLMYSVEGRSGPAINVLTHRLSGDDGDFPVLAAPGSDVNVKPQAKDICFVI